MADGTIGRANIEIGANTAPLDGDLAGAKAKVEQAAKSAEQAAQGQSGAKAQSSKADAAAAQTTRDRAAQEIRITQEILKQAAAKRTQKAEDARPPSGGDESKGFFGSIGIAGLVGGISSAVGTVTALVAGLRGAAGAARELAREMKAIGDAFAGNKLQFMGDMTQQIEEAKRIAEQQREALTDWQNSFEGIVDWYRSSRGEEMSAGMAIRSQKIATEFADSLARIRDKYKRDQMKQMEEFKLEIRKFREEINAAAGIGTTAIELSAVSDAIKTLVLRSEASR
jgi:hypothetical protein